MQTNVSDFGLPNTRRQSCNHTLSRTGPGQTRLKLYTLFRTEGPKTIPYPAARPRIAHIGEYPPPGGVVLGKHWSFLFFFSWQENGPPISNSDLASNGFHSCLECNTRVWVNKRFSCQAKKVRLFTPREKVDLWASLAKNKH